MHRFDPPPCRLDPAEKSRRTPWDAVSRLAAALTVGLCLAWAGGVASAAETSPQTGRDDFTRGAARLKLGWTEDPSAYPLIAYRLTWDDPQSRADLDHVTWYRNGNPVSNRADFVAVFNDVRFSAGVYTSCRKTRAATLCTEPTRFPRIVAEDDLFASLPLLADVPKGECKAGFVRRGINSSDPVCVPVGARLHVLSENQAGPANVQPRAGTVGPATCKPGFVWRAAVRGDKVCVTPKDRQLAIDENFLARSRQR